MRSILLFFFVLLLAVASFAACPDITNSAGYVRQGATGTGTGATWTNAFTSLPTSLSRGCTYYVAVGTYPGHIFNDAISGTTLITIKAPTIAAHGTDTGWSNTFVGEAKFNTAPAGDIIEFDTQWYVFDGSYRNADWRSGYGFHLDNTGKVVGNSAGIIDFSASNITVRYTNIEGSHSQGSPTDRGWTSFGQNNLTIEYNFNHDLGEAGCVMRGDTTSSNVLIQYNYFSDNFSQGGAGIHSELISLAEGIHSYTIRYNKFVNGVGTGAIATASSLQPNDNNNGPLYIYGNQMWYDSSLWPAQFSTYCAVGGFFSFINVGFTSDIYVFNNTIGNINDTVCPQGSGGDALITNQGDPNAKMIGGAVIHVKNNVWWNSNGGVSLTVTPTDVADNDASASGTLFLNTSAFDFHLVGHDATFHASAPFGIALTDTGGQTFEIDPDGHTRSNWDLGAFELFTGITNKRTLGGGHHLGGGRKLQ